MAVFRFLSQWFISFLIAWTPFAVNAQSAPSAATTPTNWLFDVNKGLNQAYKNPDKVVQVGNESYRVLHLNDRTQVIRISDGKELILEQVKSQQSELRLFSPSALLRKFKEAMKAGRPMDAIKHTWKTYPAESVKFFLAIGAVTALQLFTDYSSNPMRMAQHVEHSLSPLGMFSFFMFMYANGVTTNVLQVIRNKHFHTFIPYLGMTAGFFVQSAISVFAADPNVKACVKTIAMGIGRKFKGEEKQTDPTEVFKTPEQKAEEKAQLEAEAKKSEHIKIVDEKPIQHGVEGANEVAPCDAAFNFYVLKNKLDELAPSLASMIVSTMMAGMIQKGVIQGLHRVGINIAMWFMPGGVGVQAIRFTVMSMAQMGLFYYLDVAYLNPSFTWAWRNMQDGREMDDIENALVRHMKDKKQFGWVDAPIANELPCIDLKKEHDCQRNFPSVLKMFNDRANSWRMMNLMKVYEAHGAWTESLSRLNGQYHASYDFYQDLVLEMRNRQFDKEVLKLDISYPLLGVKPKDWEEGKEELMYSKPDFAQYDAAYTAVDVGVWLERIVKSRSLPEKWGLRPTALPFLQKIATGLKSGEPMTQGQAIKNLFAQEAKLQEFGGQGNFNRFVDEIRRRLGGNPTPVMEMGRGFGVSYERWSKKAKIMSEASFAYRSGIFKTTSKPDYLIVQAACGPDAENNEEVVSDSGGFGAIFTPPMLVKNDAGRPEFCSSAQPLDDETAMYKHKISHGGRNYVGVLDYLKKNMRPSVVGPKDKDTFVDWWEKETQELMKAAYERYSSRYDEIIVELLKTMRSKEDSGWNEGAMANGTIESSRQVIRVNLMILGEMLKDLYRIQQNAPLPAAFFSSVKQPTPPRIAPTMKTPFPLLALMRAGGNKTKLNTDPTQSITSSPLNSILDWDSLSRACDGSQEYKPETKAMSGYPLYVQKLIEHDIETLISFVNQIKIVNIDGKERVQSKFDNAAFEEQTVKISEKIEIFSAYFGLSGKIKPLKGQYDLFHISNPARPRKVVQLTHEQQQLALNALETIQSVSQEIALYGSMANAVSWDKIRQLKESNKKQDEFSRKVKQKFEQLSAAMK